MQTLAINKTNVYCADGLISLNSIHQASGAAKGRTPYYWLRTKRAKRLIALATSKYGTSVQAVIGKNGGTWAHRSLAIEYGMWVSPAFGQALAIKLEEFLGAPPPPTTELTAPLALPANTQELPPPEALPTAAPKAPMHPTVFPVVERVLNRLVERAQLTAVDADNYLINLLNTYLPVAIPLPTTDTKLRLLPTPEGANPIVHVTHDTEGTYYFTKDIIRLLRANLPSIPPVTDMKLSRAISVVAYRMDIRPMLEPGTVDGTWRQTWQEWQTHHGGNRWGLPEELVVPGNPPRIIPRWKYSQSAYTLVLKPHISGILSRYANAVALDKKVTLDTVCSAYLDTHGTIPDANAPEPPDAPEAAQLP
jgi:hypothetical protein